MSDDKMICGWCGYVEKDADGWDLLFHRDTHADDPRVLASSARVTALLASKPRSDGTGTRNV